MNIDQLNIMFELQALQNFNTPVNQNVSKPLFQEIFNEFITEQKLLGSTNNILQNNLPLNTINNFNNFNRNISFSPLKQELYNVGKKQTDNFTSKTNFDDIIEKAAQAYKLPAKLIKAIIKHESNFNPTAVSHAGASGLMQLMPQTARGLGVKNIFDPNENIFGGSKYIRQMLNRYNGDYKLALAAYNAGPGNVDKYKGIPPFKETQNYVTKVLNTFYS